MLQRNLIASEGLGILLLHGGTHFVMTGSLHAKRSMCCTQMTWNA